MALQDIRLKITKIWPTCKVRAFQFLFDSYGPVLLTKSGEMYDQKEWNFEKNKVCVPLFVWFCSPGRACHSSHGSGSCGCSADSRPAETLLSPVSHSPQPAAVNSPHQLHTQNSTLSGAVRRFWTGWQNHSRQCDRTGHLLWPPQTLVRCKVSVTVVVEERAAACVQPEGSAE